HHLVALQEFLGSCPGFLGDRAVVLRNHLEGPTEHASGLVDLVDCHTDAAVGALAEGGGVACQRGEVTDLDRLGCFSGAGSSASGAAREEGGAHAEGGAQPFRRATSGAERPASLHRSLPPL